MKLKKRKVSKVLEDMEPLLFELVHDSGLQMGEVLALTKAWVEIHYPGAIEVYKSDNKSPMYYYGPEDEFLKKAKRMLANSKKK